MSTPDQRKQAARHRFKAHNTFVDRGSEEADLTIFGYALWLTLWRHADPKGFASVPGSRLMRSARMSRSSLTRAIRELKDAGLLMVIEEGQPGGTAAVYRIRPVDPGKMKPGTTP